MRWSSPGALVGIVNSDDVCVVETSVSGNFNNEFVGTGKSVTLSENFTLTGSKASNYTLTQPTVTGNIIAAEQDPPSPRRRASLAAARRLT